MRKQGSLTLSKSTNGHQFSLISSLRISPCWVLANLTLPSSSFPPQMPVHRKWWVWEARGIKLVWKASAKSAFENILLGEAVSPSGAGKAGRSAGSLGPTPRSARGQTEMVLSTKQRDSMRIRAFIWSQLPADCSWATDNFLEHNNCHRAWFLLLRFYHLSNTCGVLLYMSKRIFRFHLGSQTSGYPELKSNWRTQMKNQQVNRKQYSK